MPTPADPLISANGAIFVSTTTVAPSSVVWVTDWSIVSFDVVGKFTFGSPIGFMDQGKDMFDLIKNLRFYTKYVQVVRLFGRSVHMGAADVISRCPK